MKKRLNPKHDRSMKQILVISGIAAVLVWAAAWAVAYSLSHDMLAGGMIGFCVGVACFVCVMAKLQMSAGEYRARMAAAAPETGEAEPEAGTPEQE